jgi:hypothetical protein
MNRWTYLHGTLQKGIRFLPAFPNAADCDVGPDEK